MIDRANWAQSASKRLIDEFSNTAAIDTADYQLCSFILAAARLVSERPDFAQLVGERMESPRTAK
jgi:hypothetical protein